LIRTTPAMSLLYECINGLISGGLLDSMGSTEEGEELASVCVTKLRGFLVEGDSNRQFHHSAAHRFILTTVSSKIRWVTRVHQDRKNTCPPSSVASGCDPGLH